MLREGMGVHNTCIDDVYVEILHQIGRRPISTGPQAELGQREYPARRAIH